MAEPGKALIATITPLAMASQPELLVTAQPNTTEPLALAVKLIAAVPEPAVMLPPLIVQPYVAPVPASRTVAAFPVELPQTDDAAEMVASGVGFTATVVATGDEVPQAVVRVTV